MACFFIFSIASKDTVRNLIQDWLVQWKKREEISFDVNPSLQTFPDIYLNAVEWGIRPIKYSSLSLQ